MKQFIKRIFDKTLAQPSIKFAMTFPTLPVVAIMRTLNGIQLSPTQLRLVLGVVTKQAPCKLLVFGLGNDTIFWSFINQGGETIFLEDNQFWLERVSKRSDSIDARLISYDSKRTDWKSFLECPASLEMSMPDGVNEREWDVVVVDAPAGYDDNTPGRMKSIFMASKLVKPTGDVFAHDCNREVEDIYTTTFLGQENLKNEVRSSIGWLRHYRFTQG